METLCVMTSGLIKCHISAFVAHKDTKTRTAPQIGGGWRRKNREKKAQKIQRNLFGIAKNFCAAAPDTDPRTNSETETSDNTEALRLGRCLGGRWRDVWSRLRGATLSLPGHPEGSSPRSLPPPPLPPSLPLPYLVPSVLVDPTWSVRHPLQASLRHFPRDGHKSADGLRYQPVTHSTSKQSLIARHKHL